MQDVTFETEITRNHLIRLPDALPVGVRARIRIEILTSDDREAAHDAPATRSRAWPKLRARRIWHPAAS